LFSANGVSCVATLTSSMGGSRFLVVAISERRPDTQIALSVRPRADLAVAKCFGFLAGLELGDELACLTVNDDECLQGTELSGDGTMAALRVGRLSRGVGLCLDADKVIDAAAAGGVGIAKIVESVVLVDTFEGADGIAEDRDLVAADQNAIGGVTHADVRRAG
jgi:hypothetical protein